MCCIRRSSATPSNDAISLWGLTRGIAGAFGAGPPANIEVINEVRDEDGAIARLMNNPAREDAVFFALILDPDLDRLI